MHVIDACCGVSFSSRKTTRTGTPCDVAVQLGSTESRRDYAACMKNAVCSNTRTRSAKRDLEQTHTEANANTRMDNYVDLACLILVIAFSYNSPAAPNTKMVWIFASHSSELVRTKRGRACTDIRAHAYRIGKLEGSRNKYKNAQHDQPKGRPLAPKSASKHP